MRLTDDIMRASEEATATRVGIAMNLASAGRFGLLPSTRQFQITLKLNADSIEVQALDCVAVTRGGAQIDVQFDTRYTNFLDTIVVLPDETKMSEAFLTISVDPSQWKETSDGFEVPYYTFDLIATNSPIPDNALPIAHLIHLGDSRGWHIDNEDFVPPCLFVSSHWNYVELMNQFVQKLTVIEEKVYKLFPSKTEDSHSQPEVYEAFRTLWLSVQQILIDTDKNRDLMTPMALLGNIQKFVAIFMASCRLDQYLILSDAETFRNYALMPYDYMNVYPMIKEGLNYCFAISEKLDKMMSTQPVERPKPKPKAKIEAPSIADDKLYQNCRTSVVNIPFINNVPGATVYYSVDNSEPSKPASNGKIRIKNSFSSVKEEDPDQEIVVKLKAVLDDAESDVRSFQVILHKDYKNYIQI